MTEKDNAVNRYVGNFSFVALQTRGGLENASEIQVLFFGLRYFSVLSASSAVSRRKQVILAYF